MMKKALFGLLTAIVCLPMAMGQTKPHVYKPDVQTACGSFTWIDGNTYTTTTTATYDSNDDTIHVLDLTIISGTVDTNKVKKLTGNCSAELTYRKNLTRKYEEAGIYLDTLHLPNGCDSVIKVNVTLNGAINDTTYSVSACDKYVLPWKNTKGTNDTVTTSGTYSHRDTVGGCDFTTTINVTINRSNTNRQQAVVEDVEGGCNYRFGDSVFTELNKVHYRNVPDSKGCDSVIAIRLVSLSGYQVDSTDKATCDASYKWDATNINYVQNGVYDTLKAVAATATTPACSTRYVLNLQVGVNKYDTITREVCAEYKTSFNQYLSSGKNTQEVVITQTGEYDTDADNNPLQEINNKGCITHKHLNITVHQPRIGNSDSTLRYTACDTVKKFSFSGKVFGPFMEEVEDSILLVQERNNGNYKENKCYDTTIHLNITLNHRTYVEREVTACNSYTWTEFNNVTYTESTGNKPVVVYINDTAWSDTIYTYDADSNIVDRTPNKEGSYKVGHLKNTQGCDSVGRLRLTINKSPKVNIVGDWMLQPGESTTLRATSTIDNVNYQWYRNGQAVAGSEGTADSLVVTAPGSMEENSNVDIQLTATKRYSGNNSCTDTTWLTVTSNDMGIDDATVAIVDIYPNPTSRVVKLSSSTSIASVAIYNTLGQQALVATVNANTTAIDLANFAAGTYTLRISMADGSEAVRKLIVRK